MIARSRLEPGVYYTGETEAQIAINNAIADLPTAGGEICLRPGTYNISGEIAINRNNVRIHLMAGAVIKASSGFSGDGMIVFGDGTTVYSNVGVTGPAAFSGALLDCNANAARAVFFDGPLTQIYLDGFEATDSTSTCIDATGVSAANPAKFVTFTDLYVHDVFEGVLVFKAEEVLFQAITAVDMNKGSAQDCLEFSNVVRGRIIGCFCSDPGTSNSGIDLFENCKQLVVVGNHVQATSSITGSTGIAVALGSGTITDVLIANNVIEGDFANGIANDGNDVSIVGNIIRDIDAIAAAGGIENKGDRVLIADNLISDVGQFCIRLPEAQDDVLIVNNILKDPSKGTNSSSHLKVESGSSTRIVIRGNTFLNSEASPENTYHIQNATGSDVTVEHNISDDNLKSGGRSIENQDDSGLTARFNDMHVTEASGVAAVANGDTTVVVSHTLGYTPAIELITITPNENPTNSVNNFWVSSVTSSQFTINVNTDPGASGLDFAWVVHPKVAT